MSTQIIVQIIINGLAIGSVYALIATGFSVVFSILKFSNFSHGSVMTMSAFIGYYLSRSANLPFAFVIIGAMIAGACIALIGEFVAFRRITIQNTPSIYFFVASITLGVLLDGISTLWAGANFYTYPSFFTNDTIRLGDYVVSTSNIIMFACSMLALLVLTFILKKTKIGRGLRSVSFDRDTASLMGINVTRTIQLAFIIAGSLAGMSGVFLGINFTVTTALGSMAIKGFIASVVGGLGSISGAVVGALLLGFAETLLTYYLGTGYKEAIVFLVMILFLYVRPQGISGSNVQEKA